MKHAVLEWLLAVTELTDKLARWQIRALHFVPVFVHRTGVKTQTPDVLSCFRAGGSSTKTLENEITVITIFDTRQTQNENLRNGSTEEDSTINGKLQTGHTPTRLQSSRYLKQTRNIHLHLHKYLKCHTWIRNAEKR